MSNPADMVPFAKHLGIEIMETGADKVTAKMLVKPELCTLGSGGHTNVIHGGAVMTFADVLGAFGSFYNLPEGAKGTTTSESKTNFLNPAGEGETVYGESVPLKTGKRLSVWQTRITREDGTLVAMVTQTQIVL